jgi:hypothetical protein
VHNLPFDKPGQFFRGNLHTHSTRSDGGRAPEQVVNDYRSRGYDFLSLTDHFLPNAHFRKDEPGFITVTDTTPYDSDQFVTILGAEVHGPAMENGEIWHLVAVGLPDDFPPLGENESGVEVARRAAEAGAWVSLAHPHWNAVSERDALEVADFIHAVEVYNHASEMGVRRGWGMHQADVLLAKGHRVQLNAADDAHLKNEALLYIDAFGGWVQVKAASLSSGNILAALKAGHYYSSTGPELHNVEIRDGTIRVESSPVLQVIVSGLGATYRHPIGISQVDVELELPSIEKTPYVRVSVIDANGRMAWTNPIWRD